MSKMIKRLGLAAFAMFFLKGVLWLVIGYFALAFRGCT